MKPGDFHVTVIDFFAIMLPGAVLVAALHGAGATAALAPLAAASGELGRAELWAVFLAAAYAAGHLVFLFASMLDPLGDELRRGAMVGAPAKAALKAVAALRDRALGDGGSGVNAFSWSKAFLARHHPAALADVQRHEADSKFFRSFVVVLGALAALAARDGRPGLVVVLALVAIPCFWRYVERRQKAIDWAYRHVLTWHGRDAAQP